MLNHGGGRSLMRTCLYSEFPVIRENTGKKRDFYSILENSPKLMTRLQWFTDEFPKKDNREFICLNREIFLWNREKISKTGNACKVYIHKWKFKDFLIP